MATPRKAKTRKSKQKAAAIRRSQEAGSASTHSGAWWTNKMTLGILAGILILTAICYSSIFSHELTNWDDEYYIVNNDLLPNGSFSDIITTPVVANHHPVTIFSLKLNYMISGLNPAGYLGTNLFLHLINCFLVFMFVFLISGRKKGVSLISALLFAVHPMHVESVAWASGRKDVLFAFFFLLSLISYFYYLENKQIKWYAAVLLLFFLSAFSKPAAVPLPFVLLLMDYWLGRKWEWRILWEKIPHFALAVIAGLLTIKAQVGVEAVGDFDRFSIVERLALTAYTFVIYIVKFIVPYKLSVFHPYSAGALASWYYSFILLAAGLFAGAYFLRKKSKVPLFGLLFYSATIALVLQFVSVGGAMIAERYSYLPYIGLGFIVGMGYEYLAEQISASGRRNARIALGLVVLAGLIFSVMTFNRTKVWKNSEVLWTSLMAQYPEYYLGYEMRGMYYKNQERKQEAFADFNRCLSLKPNLQHIYVQRGLILKASGQFDQALTDYNQAIALNAKDKIAYVNRANVFLALKQYQNALADQQKALELDPNDPEVYTNRAAVYATMGQNDQAMKDLSQALQLDPGYMVAIKNRGLLSFNLQNYPQAIQDLDMYLKTQPADHSAVHIRGLCQMKTGNLQAALSDISKSISLNGNVGSYYYDRSLLHKARGDVANARADALKAQSMGLQLDPAYLEGLQ